jgi:hypothetical protein
MHAIQYVETAKDETTAREMLAFLATQVDYVGGRLLPPGVKCRDWQVQAFFAAPPAAGWLPDGCRRVIILAGQRKALGIN